MNLSATSLSGAQRFTIHDGTVETLKWLAVLLMCADHANKYLFNETLPYCFEAGRIAMPIFVFVLAYNLARPDAGARGIYHRTLVRLSLFAVIATPPFLILGSLTWGWWPLNILFTLLLVTAIVSQIDSAESRGKLRIGVAAALFIIGSAFVEFWWPAVALGVGFWAFSKRPNWIAGVAVAVSLLSLYWINGNFWALGVLPIIILASKANIPLPRMRWFFYAFYPLHLIALIFVRIHMIKVGYLIF